MATLTRSSSVATAASRATPFWVPRRARSPGARSGAPVLDRTDLEWEMSAPGLGAPTTWPAEVRPRPSRARASRLSAGSQTTFLRRLAKTGLGVVLMLAAGALLARDAFPEAFPADTQRLLAALPLTLVALSYLAYQGLRRPGPRELL